MTQDGWRARIRLLAERIERSDAYARSLLDMVYEGITGMVVATFIEYKDAPLAMVNPWSTMAAVGAHKLIVSNAANPVGRLASDKAGSLTLTAVANTPAATRGPATVTYGKAIQAPDTEIEFPLGPQHRTYGVTLDLLLYLSTSDYILYSGT